MLSEGPGLHHSPLPREDLSLQDDGATCVAKTYGADWEDLSVLPASPVQDDADSTSSPRLWHSQISSCCQNWQVPHVLLPPMEVLVCDFVGGESELPTVGGGAPESATGTKKCTRWIAPRQHKIFPTPSCTWHLMAALGTSSGCRTWRPPTSTVPTRLQTTCTVQTSRYSQLCFSCAPGTIMPFLF